MSRAWTFQDSRAQKKLGTKAPWSVGWIDPDRVRHSRKIGSKSMADKYARKLEGQLAAGIYQGESRKQWGDFRAEYEAKIFSGMEPGTRQETRGALNHFERLVKPGRMAAITTATIDGYIEKRRQERGRKRGSTVSPATVNKELRHIRTVLRKARKWKCLPEVPDFDMLREPEKLVTYVTQDHFTMIYQACDVATMPKGLPYPPAEWWRVLATYAYMTGWRIGEPLALRWDDVSLDNGTAITRHGDNKGKRDDLAPLHPVVVEHLRRIVDAAIEWPVVFPWPHHRSTLWCQFEKIQVAAGIHLPCHEDHEHTPRCHVYGFHDFRRAFATVNHENLSGDALQRLMRHRSYSTTQRYINMADKLNQSVEGLKVPDVLKNQN